MEKLRVGAGSLQAMASRWQTQAGELSVPAPSVYGLPSQASNAAVNAGHADVSVAANKIAKRVQVTAAKVIEANSHYLANEAASASVLRAVARP